jgi:hypothetical protein
LYANAKFGTNKFKQASVSGSSIAPNYLDGNLAYSIFYDRPIYDYELEDIFNKLKVRLAAERGVALLSGNAITPQVQLGIARIYKTNRPTQTGRTNVVKSRVTKIQAGTMSVRRRTQRTMSGVSKII